jgi:carbonic anhydrase/acetyltransferase-like protein (isoleucine patch superfamily)
LAQFHSYNCAFKVTDFPMPIYRLGDAVPQIDPTAWVADSATIIGQVTLGPGVSVWYGAVLRGDNEPIVIGARSNVQEGAVLHTDPGRPLTVGEDVTVGHMVMLHGCTVGDGSLIGIQAVLLNGATIGRGCLVGAGALVTEDKTFPDGSLILGTPAVLKRALTPGQIEDQRRTAQGYVARAARYRETRVRVG